MQLLAKAMDDAYHFHKGQVRKHSGIPYFSHCVEVMNLTREYLTDEASLCKAVLHDVLEDTPMERTYLFNEYGYNVYTGVVGLTQPWTPQGTPRPDKKRAYREMMLGQDEDTKTIKCVDRFANLTDLLLDEQFQKLRDDYIPETHLLMEVLEGADEDALQMLAETTFSIEIMLEERQ